MDLLIGSGSLILELVAGDVDNLKALVMVLLIHLLNGFVLGSEAAARGGVDDHDDLALEVGEIQRVSGSGGEFIIIYRHCENLLIG